LWGAGAFGDRQIGIQALTRGNRLPYRDAALDAEINQRSTNFLWSVAGRIPAYVPAQDKLFYLAHLKEFLEAYAKIGSDIWPDFFRVSLGRGDGFFSIGQSSSFRSGAISSAKRKKTR
jgi:hypothetical protein